MALHAQLNFHPVPCGGMDRFVVRVASADPRPEDRFVVRVASADPRPEDRFVVRIASADPRPETLISLEGNYSSLRKNSYIRCTGW